jgi:hypothetical protein
MSNRKLGRHNSYEINPSLPLRDPLLENESVRDLLRLVSEAEGEGHEWPGAVSLPTVRLG